MGGPPSHAPERRPGGRLTLRPGDARARSDGKRAPGGFRLTACAAAPRTHGTLGGDTGVRVKPEPGERP
ncbi:hypothetical protein GCM10010420_27150 [Streptomyces glaucosporus]|uniref:Uncharacterized protein n=1 Tax=Streptomyces glaucosporus TaxID=284044 RepID=A0ABN3IAH3_9ACTN